MENDVDIVALVETNNLDMQGVINGLKLQTKEWKVLEICPEADIRVLAKSNIQILVIKRRKDLLPIKYLTRKKYIYLSFNRGF